MFESIEQLITTINENNEKIDVIKESISSKIDSIKKFNNKLIRFLQLFITKTTFDCKKVVIQQFDEINDLVNLS